MLGFVELLLCEMVKQTRFQNNIFQNDFSKQFNDNIIWLWKHYLKIIKNIDLEVIIYIPTMTHYYCKEFVYFNAHYLATQNWWSFYSTSNFILFESLKNSSVDNLKPGHCY